MIVGISRASRSGRVLESASAIEDRPPTHTLQRDQKPMRSEPLSESADPDEPTATTTRGVVFGALQCRARQDTAPSQNHALRVDQLLRSSRAATEWTRR